MSKEIKGQIDYTFTINGDVWELEYERSVENEIAAVSIAQHVMESAIATSSLQKKEAKGKSKSALGKQIEKFIQARFGLSILSELLCSSYEAYKEKQEQHAKDMLTAEVTPEEQKMMVEAMRKVEERRK